MQCLLRWRRRGRRPEYRGEGGVRNQSDLGQITFSNWSAAALAERYIVQRLVNTHQTQGFPKCLKRDVVIEIQGPARRLGQGSIKERMGLRRMEAVIALLGRSAIRRDDGRCAQSKSLRDEDLQVTRSRLCAILRPIGR